MGRGRLKQNSHTFEANLGYRVRPISKNTASEKKQMNLNEIRLDP